MTSANVPPTNADTGATLEVLRLLAAQPELSQRQLSRALGLSLGKTHYLLHALLDTGFLKLRNFKRSGNKLGYVYLLTPKGVAQKLQITRAFLARKEMEFEMLQATITQLRSEVEQISAAQSDRSSAKAAPDSLLPPA